MRPLDLRGCSFVLTFQFTHPGRGATQKRKNADKKHGCFNSRTPGGVRLNDTEEIERGDTSFNSRTPGGVRLVNIRSRDRAITFQFTHPGRGATIDGWSSNINISVSIHAPREGCDPTQRTHQKRAGRFNSRTPGGVRLMLAIWLIRQIMFQFTHPGRGATF